MEDIRTNISRRAFLKGAAGAAAAAGMAGAMPGWTGEALADPRRRGRMDDIEHVVILMQENRSFDHYYGTMRGASFVWLFPANHGHRGTVLACGFRSGQQRSAVARGGVTAV